jgi:Flp pilus assembly protein TadG
VIPTREDGTVTVFVVTFMLALLVVAGLVFDGGYLLAARREAANVAESAARAGAQALDTDALRATGEVRVDRDRAVTQAEQYLSRSGYEGSATVEDGVVVVDVTITRRLFILGIAGFSKSSVTGQGRARPVRGVQVEGN